VRIFSYDLMLSTTWPRNRGLHTSGLLIHSLVISPYTSHIVTYDVY